MSDKAKNRKEKKKNKEKKQEMNGTETPVDEANSFNDSQNVLAMRDAILKLTSRVNTHDRQFSVISDRLKTQNVILIQGLQRCQRLCDEALLLSRSALSIAKLLSQANYDRRLSLTPVLDRALRRVNDVARCSDSLGRVLERISVRPPFSGKFYSLHVHIFIAFIVNNFFFDLWFVRLQ